MYRFEIKNIISEDPQHGTVYFNMIAANGEIVATSEVYTTVAAAQDTIKSIMLGVGDARVINLTGETTTT